MPLKYYKLPYINSPRIPFDGIRGELQIIVWVWFGLEPHWQTVPAGAAFAKNSFLRRICSGVEHIF